MLRKEIKDTVRVLTYGFLVALVGLIVTYIIADFTTDHGFTFNELLCTTIEIILLIVVLLLASGTFAEEKRENSFEYLLSLKLTRMQILMNKVLPRFAAVLICLLISLLFSSLLAQFPLLLGSGIFIPLLFRFTFSGPPSPCWTATMFLIPSIISAFFPSCLLFFSP